MNRLGIWVGKITMTGNLQNRMCLWAVMSFAGTTAFGCEDMVEGICESQCTDKYDECMADDRTADISCRLAFNECKTECQLPD